jgi:hypothetical protein
MLLLLALGTAHASFAKMALVLQYMTLVTFLTPGSHLKNYPVVTEGLRSREYGGQEHP